MVEAFEAVLPQSILAKLEPFSFAICCKDGGYAICLQSFKALSDDVYHGPLTKYIDKNNWFGFVDDVKSKPEYKARLAELHVPAAIAPEIELLELHEQWNDHNKYVIDNLCRLWQLTELAIYQKGGCFRGEPGMTRLFFCVL